MIREVNTQFCELFTEELSVKGEFVKIYRENINKNSVPAANPVQKEFKTDNSTQSMQDMEFFNY